METKPSKQDWLVFLFMLLLVPLAGEPKFHPFDGDFASFRVSFGSPVFLLFLLWLRPFPRFFLGCAAGIAVVLFRTGLDLVYGTALPEALLLHIATFFYYACYALFFALPHLVRKSVYEQSLAIALWAIIAEIFASVAELAVMSLIAFQSHEVFTLGMLFRLFLIATLRCFFILSFFYLFQLYTTEMRLARKTQERDRLALLIAGLYEEAFALRGTMQSAEDMTRDCYKAYERLRQDEGTQETAQELLRIAGKCHEIKKNSQRIYAALCELTNNRHVDDYLPPDEIVRLLVHAQEKYARSLGKDISFQTDVPRNLPPLHVFLLLSLLNNLASNAVEAIPARGTISLSIRGGDGTLRIHVSNTGSFIPADRLAHVVQPGYTTKFDTSGKASSGVGLTYVKQKTESYGGSMTIVSDGKSRVDISILLPCQKLQRPSDPSKKEGAFHELHAD